MSAFMPNGRGVDLGRPSFGVGRMGRFPQLPPILQLPQAQDAQANGPPSTARQYGVAEALANPVTVESGGIPEALAEALGAGLRGRAARADRQHEESLLARELARQDKGDARDAELQQAQIARLLAQTEAESAPEEPRVTQSGTFWRPNPSSEQGYDVLGRDPNWQPPASMQMPQPGMPVQGAAGYLWGPNGSMVPAQGGPAERRINTEQAQRARGALARLEDQGTVVSAIRRARDLAGSGETGAVGALMRNVPGTRALGLDAQLDIIRANIAFDSLQEMRANSPTGGALGAVSERELLLLQSTLESLNQAQRREDFIAGLDRLEQQYRGAMERVRQAYEQDFGGGMPGPGEAPAEEYVDPAAQRVLRWNPETGRLE